mgnify:CR=1 FL=1
MTTTKNLVYLSLFVAASVGCDVKNDLGETAGATESGSGGGTDGTSGDTGVVDTGPWSETGMATESDSDTTSGGDTGVLDTGPWWGTSSGTGGELDDCEPSDVMVRWDSASVGPQGVFDFGSTFVGVGTCTHAVEPFGDGMDPLSVTVPLQCTLSGTRDGNDFVDELFDIDIDFVISGGGLDLLPSFADTLTARFFVGSPGLAQGSDRYVVLEQPLLKGLDNVPALFASEGFGLEPSAEQVQPWYEGDWYNGPGIEAVDATCATGDAPECGFDVAVRTNWAGEALDLHGTQSGSTVQALDIPAYDLYVRTAWQAPNALDCGDDFPGSEYALVGFAM